MKRIGNNDFFRVGADGTPPVGDATDSVIVETVADPGVTTTTVTEEVPSLGSEDTASVNPDAASEEVTTETETVRPRTHHHSSHPYPYPVIYPPGYAYPTYVVEEPTVIIDSSELAENRSGVPITNKLASDESRNQTRFLITWLIMVGLGILLYRSVGKKI